VANHLLCEAGTPSLFKGKTPRGKLLYDAVLSVSSLDLFEI
jgi:hypothetical protein